MFMDTAGPLGYLAPMLLGMFSFEGEGGEGGGDEGGGEGGEGEGSDKGGTDWKSDLSEGARNHPVLEKYNNKNEAVEALVAAQVLIGRDKIPLPPDDATPEDWNEVYTRLGRPDKAEDYKLPEVEMPEGLPVDDTMVAGFRESAHKLGLLPQQVEGLYQWFMETQKAQFNTFTQGQADAVKEAETALRTEWGQAYDQNLALAKKALHAVADEKAVAFLNEGLGNNPHILRMLSKVGSLLGEDTMAGKPKGMTMTPEEAQAEILKLEGDLKGPLFDDTHREHKAMVEKRDALYKMAYPEGKK